MSARPGPAAGPREAAPAGDNATEVAAAIVSLAKSHLAFPEIAAQDLRRLLGNSLAVDSAAERRQASLGLLIELVADDGEFVPTTTYEEIRKERLSREEEWPTASTLSRLYGHWLAAVRAACRFWFDGGPQRVASSHRHAVGPQPGYQPSEILSTLLSARRDLELPDGHWPSQWEYSEWAEVKRRLTRRSGSDHGSQASSRSERRLAATTARSRLRAGTSTQLGRRSTQRDYGFCVRGVLFKRSEMAVILRAVHPDGISRRIGSVMICPVPMRNFALDRTYVRISERGGDGD